MWRGTLASGRALAVCAALTAVVAGCSAGSSTSSVTVSGKTLTIYASAPVHTLDPAQTQDVLDAEKLALAQNQSKVTAFTLRFQVLQGGEPEARQVTDNARSAIEDTSAIAYIGEVDPGASAGSIAITNDQDLLQVSPTDTALEYTQTTRAIPTAPTVYYQEEYKTYGYTFSRVVPNSLLEAQAQAREMTSLAVSKLYVASDGSPYGSAVALAVAQKAAAGGITVVQGVPDAAKVAAAGVDGVFFGASTPDPAAAFFNAVAAASPQAKLFGTSSLNNPTFAAALGANARPHAYVSAPGFLPGDLVPAGATFVSDFKAHYGHAPALGAIFGYEAMAAVIDVLKQAGTGANNRATVVHDFLTIQGRESVVGKYSISYGDPTVGRFVFSRFVAGQLTPFTSIEVPG